jgi:hypothetical protein
MTTYQNDWYAHQFKFWRDAECGPKPTDQHLETAHAFGKPGKQSLAVAMALRDCGVDTEQMKAANGGKMQRNHLGDMIKAGELKRNPKLMVSAAGYTCWQVELTAKGKHRVEQKAKAAAQLEALGKAVPTDKPAKPIKVKKAVTKPKAKAKPKAEAEVPASDVVSAADAVITNAAPDTLIN